MGSLRHSENAGGARVLCIGCALMIVLSASTAQALWGLKDKIQKELDANPFLKEQKIKIQVAKEENGYVSLEMAEGNRKIREAVNKGADVLTNQVESDWVFRSHSQDEEKSLALDQAQIVCAG